MSLDRSIASTPASRMAFQALHPVRWEAACARCAMQWEEAKLLVESMSDAGVAPRRNLYNVLLDVMGDAGQWQRARELFEGLAAEGLPPDTTAFSTLMHGLGVAGKWQEAETVLDEMKVSFAPLLSVLRETRAALTCPR